jgi:hypothetical protein
MRALCCVVIPLLLPGVEVRAQRADELMHRVGD